MSDLAVRLEQEQQERRIRVGHSQRLISQQAEAALALGKPTFVVGPRENVFHCLPQVRVFPSWRECRDALSETQEEQA